MRGGLARVWDPLYGLDSLDEFEQDLILLPEVQRLRFVRLCNINSLLITGAAEISRFEHSLGVLRLAKEWLAAQAIEVTSAQSQCLRAAALLHDIQTGPFGHSLQYVLEDNQADFSHEDVDRGLETRYFQDLDANASFAGKPFGAKAHLGSLWGGVSQLIQGKGELGPLISGRVDFDNIDNVLRLAFHCGSSDSGRQGLPLRLSRALSLQSGHLTTRARDIPLLVEWQSVRERLYELLLLDWAEFSAKAMLTRAIELALSHELIGVESWIFTDDELLSRLESKGIGEAQAVAELVKRLRLGDLYFPLFMGTSPSIERYKDLSSPEAKCRIEGLLTREARSDLRLKGEVIFHPILDVGKTRRSVDVKLQDGSESVTIGSNSSQLLVGVFLSARPRSPRSSTQFAEAAQAVLASVGLEDIQRTSDPMSPHFRAHKGDQLSLL